MDRPPQWPTAAAAATDDLINDVAVVQHARGRLPSTSYSRQAPAAAAELAPAAACCRITVGPDEAFPLPPSPLVKPKSSSSG